MLGAKVVGFGDVGAEIVELDGGQALFGDFGIAGFSPPAGTGAESEFPAALTHGEAAVDAVMHDALTRCSVLRAEQRGE